MIEYLDLTDATFEELCAHFGYTPKGRPVSTKEAASMADVHPMTFEAYRARGEGPRFFQPPGTRRIWYAEVDVLRWLASGSKLNTSEAAA
ncbi:hypothetical protein EF888_19955 [Silicimonas algicola]|uniref:Helix-turn-helix protein n=1 Tax=Silicimonas algicola TaxID=1826607 RepID=A0A316G234_9RHOB|nr:hypothetical protein [Silicimonas algicola]AZQ69206.1 hypothetical protein EF888_19955 [Silicimonas algicola]PWK54981.1 hypothetical protein C8D95_10968 [Silicimonas algicola]